MVLQWVALRILMRMILLSCFYHKAGRKDATELSFVHLYPHDAILLFSSSLGCQRQMFITLYIWFSTKYTRTSMNKY